MLERQKLPEVAQVPLSKKSSGITKVLEHLRDKNLVVGDAPQRARTRGSEHVNTIRVAAGK